MLAFVLSGGGNRGALQVGALQVLLDRGIYPDLMVGTSAGAMNAVFLAADPTPTGAQRLARLWETVTRQRVYPGGHLQVLWRLVRNRASLYPNNSFQRLLRAYLRAAHLRRFRDLPSGVKLYVVAADLATGQERVFGNDEEDRLLDALMATTAMPPLHPPWHCEGTAYVDGAFTANLPVHLAAARGASEIYALHIAQPVHAGPTLRGVLDITFRAAGAFLNHQLEDALQVEKEWPGIKLHYVSLVAYANLAFWDFSHAGEMIRAGRATMEEYLDASSLSHNGLSIAGRPRHAGISPVQRPEQVTVRTTQ